MRLLVGELSHESNCFCAGPTRLADFEAHQFLLGDAVLEAHRARRIPGCRGGRRIRESRNGVGRASRAPGA